MTSNGTDAALLKARFFASLPLPLRSAVESVVEQTQQRRSSVYAVAGVVRDLLLERSPVDVDLVMESDARDIARAVAVGPVAVHDQFLTATIEVGLHRLDLATSRRETYRRPGALPDVETAGIEEDMRRRDFAMNAIALRLDGDPAIIDPCGGIGDIEAGVVRVLHDGSFRDDATRILRAFRYAARLGFAIEPYTRSLLTEGVRYIETISGERLRHELHLLFEERTGGSALEGLDAVGALAAIHPSLRWPARATSALAEDAAQGFDRVLVGFALLAFEDSADEAAQTVERLQLSREEADAVRAMPSLTHASVTLGRRDAKPSGIVAVLDRYPAAAVTAFAWMSEDRAVAALARRYLDQWRQIHPILTGDDLREMGIPEGPDIGKGLQLIRAARLDGWASDRDDERALALRFAKSIRESRAMKQPIDFHRNDN